MGDNKIPYMAQETDDEPKVDADSVMTEYVPEVTFMHIVLCKNAGEENMSSRIRGA